jgi:hypothetical protein
LFPALSNRSAGWAVMIAKAKPKPGEP